MDLIKTAVLVYDTLTLPFYYLIQKPWKRRSDRPTARLVKEAPNLEYLVRVGDAPKSHLDHYENVSQAMSDVCARYSSQKCFGVRECIFEEEIPIEKGKVHKKKVLAPGYRWYTYSQVDVMIDALMRGLRESGLEPGSRVVIFSETRMEWMLAFHSLVRMNCTVVTLYSNLGRDGILHVLNEVEAQFAIVSSEVLSKVKSISKDLKYLSNIVVIGPENSAANTEGLEKFTIENFGSVMSKGSESGHLLKASSPKPSDIVLIMYTSGSTGIPKGVQISHRNFISSTRSMVTIIDQYGQCRTGHYIAYLPLAHVFECFVESTLLWMGHSIGYSNPLTLTDSSPALKEGVKGDLTTLQPILLCGVPLVLDRIRKEVTKKVESGGGLKEKLFKFSVDYKNYWLSKGYKTPILDRIVFKQTVAALGGHCEVIVSGGAPLSLATQRFARACLGADLVAGYSATECASSGTCMDIGDSTLGNVGAPLYGIKIRLVAWADGSYYPTDKPNPRGEIVIGGDNIAMGYFNNPEETKLSFKEEYGERWFYTGDIGEILPNGSIKIIDRRKDLVKLQLGEYISLGKVEAALLGHPLVDFVCLHGDSLHNFPVALIVPNAQGLLALAKSLNLHNKTIDELCENSTIIEAVKVSLVQYSGKVGLNKYEVPQKIKLCKEEWTPDSGLVTAAMKVRRNEIKKFYCEDLKHLYGSENFDQNQNMRKV